MEASVEPGHSYMSASSVPTAGSGAATGPWEPLVQACAAVTPLLTETLQQFWGVDVRLTLLGVSGTMHYFWRPDDFHVSQLTLEAPTVEDSPAVLEPPTALLRLSDAACSTLLTRVLGPRKSGFSFKQLSPLEATVLNEFSRDILTTFKKELLRKPGKSPGRLLHLMWVFTPAKPSTGKQPPPEVGKIILSVPGSAIRLPQREPSTTTEPTRIPDEFFFHVDGVARIFLGTTRVTLADLDHLEPEDVIVLENSHVGTMSVIEPLSGEKIPFQADIQHPQPITIPYTQELAMMETQSQPSASAKQALWDNLMIEVGAEFEPIKLPLKQLKQMTEGLVIEMGDLVHNRVCLQVEGKPLAWGELIIVGDKFGVRICQVDATHEQASPANSSQAAPAALPAGDHHLPPQAMEQPSAPSTAEEENLDNFLNEDFDDTFEDDEEDW
jgi:flagellar motor switch protein FliN/FliY